MGQNQRSIPVDSRVLVTGATGFLGSHVVQALISKGRTVRATGRDLEKGLALSRCGAEFRPVDLCDRAAVIRSCEDVDAVIHSGAMVTSWGDPADYWKINVEGTQNVIDGCLRHGVRRLVYVSTPSVATRPEPQLDISEQDPLPTGISPYAETKKIGEERVREARRDGLEAVILRPKAIYGPGDNALLPRLLERAQQGRLVRIKGCDPVTDLTHVTDVVQACLLALTSRAAEGRTYFITGGQPVALWELIGQLIDQLGYPPPRKEIPLALGKALANALPVVWRGLRLGGEPPLTMFTLSILAHSQTYDISAARRDLGYDPKISLQDGLQEVIAAWQRGDTSGAITPCEAADRPSPAAAAPTATVKCTLFSAGHCRTRQRLVRGDGDWTEVRLPVLVAAIEHPTRGLTLFDTGYSPRFFDATRRLPFWLFRLATPVEVTWDETAAARLRALSFDPDDVERVIISHFDPDHIGGLRDFPRARIICSRQAWQAVSGKAGLAAMMVRVLPGHLPDDMAARLELVDPPADPFDTSAGPFDTSVDLFGDGSVRLVSLPGHSPGQIGALLQLEGGRQWLLAGDGCWLRAALACESHMGHRLVAYDGPRQDQTYRLLRTLSREHPEVTIVPSHCPDTADELCEPGNR